MVLSLEHGCVDRPMVNVNSLGHQLPCREATVPAAVDRRRHSIGALSRPDAKIVLRNPLLDLVKHFWHILDHLEGPVEDQPPNALIGLFMNSANASWRIVMVHS